MHLSHGHVSLACYTGQKRFPNMDVDDNPTTCPCVCCTRIEFPEGPKYCKDCGLGYLFMVLVSIPHPTLH